MYDTKHYKNIDVLRFISALWVVSAHYLYAGVAYQHYAPLTNNAVVTQFSYMGYLGVSIFFAISGFVIVHISQNISPLEFVARRGIRIIPGFWLCMSCSAVLMAVLNSANAPSLSQWLANFILLPHLLGHKFIDNSYWTLIYELIFYGWVAILLCSKKFHQRLEFICLSWLVLSFVNQFWLNSSILKHLFITHDSGAFCIGLILWKINKLKATPLRLLVLLLANIALASGLSQLIVFQGPGEAATSAPFIVHLLSAPFVTLLLWVALRAPENWISKRTTLLVGGVSYPLYLLHQEVGYAAFTSAPATFPPLLLLALVVSCVLVLAFFIFRLEWHIRQMLRQSILAALNQIDNMRTSLQAKTLRVYRRLFMPVFKGAPSASPIKRP